MLVPFVAVVVVVIVVSVFMTGGTFSRLGLKIAFEGFSRTQRFAFQALRAPSEILIFRTQILLRVAPASEAAGR